MDRTASGDFLERGPVFLLKTCCPVPRYGVYNEIKRGDVMTQGLTIGQLSKMSDVHLETIRYYERIGLIPQPPRNESGYRVYPYHTVSDVGFIKRAQDIGFSLEEIRVLLVWYNRDQTETDIQVNKEERQVTKEDMTQFARNKISEIEEKIRQLTLFKSLLEEAVSSREQAMDFFTKENCPVIQYCSKREESCDV